MQRKQFPLVLNWTKPIAPSVLHLNFHIEGETTFQFIPGQFITLLIDTPAKQLRRSYSVANTYHDGSNIIEFAASYVEGGIASELLFNLNPGDKLTASGPFGRLVLRNETPARYIFVATGTGVTPYRAMLVELEKRLSEQEQLQVVLLFGVRKPEDLLYGNEFGEFAAKNPRFEFRAYYSREFPESAKPHEYPGHVSKAFAEINPNPQHDVVYLCGNPHMIDDIFAILVNQGFPTENIRREKYISSH